MALSNSQLYDRFAAGHDSGQANRMEIKYVGDIDHPDVEEYCNAATAVVAYGWAVYAVRARNGTVHVFEGWKDWAEEVGNCAEATPRHISALKHRADEVHDGTPQADDAPQALVSQLKHGSPRGIGF